MDTGIQQRLRKQLQQLWTENALFQRVMYKNKNQHRRCLYFRRLSQVQRDLNLLQSLGLNEIVEKAAFYCPSQIADGQRWTRSQVETVTASLQSLLGAARLLEQMDEPILKSSSEIAGLLGSSFFMPFALTTFSSLARFRVLLVQIMYDVVALWNVLAATCQDKGSRKQVKLMWQRRMLPSVLECHWAGDHLNLVEKRVLATPEENEIPDEPESLATPMVQWVLDDRTGKMLDLQSQDSCVEKPHSGTPPSSVIVPADVLKSGEARQAVEEACGVDARDDQSSGKDADLVASPETEACLKERRKDLPAADPADSPLHQSSRKREQEDEAGAEQPKKRVAYLSVKPIQGPKSIVPPPAVKPVEGANPQRTRTDEIFNILLGRTGKSLF